ncbi:MAG: hypothetical protein C5B50_17560 [Verrucomicrobia bacterium]|nr:MAG: hypothetical protein C5B50_17560 [Verrucomicrobiota bacterium]
MLLWLAIGYLALCAFARFCKWGSRNHFNGFIFFWVWDVIPAGLLVGGFVTYFMQPSEISVFNHTLNDEGSLLVLLATVVVAFFIALYQTLKLGKKEEQQVKEELERKTPKDIGSGLISWRR